MRAMHSSQVSGAAEEIEPMLFDESASTPAISSTPFTLAPPCSCESKSCDFIVKYLLLLSWLMPEITPPLLSVDP